MAIGFPALDTQERTFPVSYEELLEAIGDAFDVLGWLYEVQGPGSFRVKKGISMTSYGERIEIQASEDGVVRVKSRCAWPLQMFDWGKNRGNTNEFLDSLTRLLAR